MGGLRVYFRRNRWQWRLLTISLMMVLGAGIGLLAWPAYRNYRIEQHLASDDSSVYLPAIAQASRLAKTDSAFARSLERKLDTPNDRLFANIIAALGNAGLYPSGRIPPKYADRIKAIDAEASPLYQVRWQAMWDLLLTDRDNKYIREALAAAATDDTPVVRKLAAVLAAKLADDETLAALLKDAEPQVVAAAAIAAGAANRSALQPELLSAREAADPNAAPSVAWAMVKLSPDSPGVLDGRSDPMLYVLGMDTSKKAGNETAAALNASWEKTGFPSPQALLAAAEHRLASTGPAAKKLLSAVARGDSGNITVGQLIAAVQAADTMNVPCLPEAEAVCRKLWSTQSQMAMVHAARLLGRQILAARKRGRPDEVEQIAAGIKTLQHAALYEGPTTRPAGRPVTTPVASAAAALALWECRAPEAEHFLRNAAAADATLAGDYIASQMARLDPNAAFELGLRMLPPPFNPRRPAPEQPPRVFNNNERGCGAMMLAWAARGTPKAPAAVERIRLRLTGGPFGRGASDWQEQNTLRCALLILGEEKERDAVRRLLHYPQFPQRRSLGALIAAADRQAMDWLLWNPNLPDADLLVLLLGKDVGTVLAEFFAGLPTIQPAATPGIQQWQVQMLRYTYIINRAKLGLKGGRK